MPASQLFAFLILGLLQNVPPDEKDKKLITAGDKKTTYIELGFQFMTELVIVVRILERLLVLFREYVYNDFNCS